MLRPDEEVKEVTHKQVASLFVESGVRSILVFQTGLCVSKTYWYSRHSEADRSPECEATLDRMAPSASSTITHPRLRPFCGSCPSLSFLIATTWSIH